MGDVARTDGYHEVFAGETAGPGGGGGGDREEEVAAPGGGEAGDEGRVDEAENYEREAYKGGVFSRRELRGTKLISREHEFNSYGMVYVQIKPNYD